MTKFTGSITYRCALSSASTLFIATGTSYLIAKLQNLFAVWPQVDHKWKIRYVDAHKYSQMRPAGDSQVACKWLADVRKYIKSRRWLAGVLQLYLKRHSYILFHLESDRERSHATSLSWKFLLDPIYQSSQWLLWVSCPNSGMKLLNLIWIFQGIFQTYV